MFAEGPSLSPWLQHGTSSRMCWSQSGRPTLPSLFLCPQYNYSGRVLGLDQEGEKERKKVDGTVFVRYCVVCTVLLRHCIYSVGRWEEGGMEEGVDESRMAVRRGNGEESVGPRRGWFKSVEVGGVLKQMAKGRVASTPGFSLFYSHPQR